MGAAASNVKPKRKVAAGGVAGAVVTLMLILWPRGAQALGAAGAAAVTTLANFALAYFVPEADTSQPVGTQEP